MAAFTGACCCILSNCITWLDLGDLPAKTSMTKLRLVVVSSYNLAYDAAPLNSEQEGGP